MKGSGTVKMMAAPVHAETLIFDYPVKLEKLEHRVLPTENTSALTTSRLQTASQ